jgi:dTDP-4-amino-4,6-dideoxygalactose transaminase
VATKIADSVICLPMYHTITEKEIDKIIKTINK